MKKIDEMRQQVPQTLDAIDIDENTKLQPTINGVSLQSGDSVSMRMSDEAGMALRDVLTFLYGSSESKECACSANQDEIEEASSNE
jgi:hypothetical protein